VFATWLFALDSPPETATQILNYVGDRIHSLAWIIVGAALLYFGALAYVQVRKVVVEASLIRRARAAESALQLANAEGERLRLILQCVATALQRKTTIDHPEPPGSQSKPMDGVENLVQKIVEILSLEQSDIIKMTVWQPTQDGKRLRIIDNFGMNPESARQLQFDIHPACDDDDSFAAMAFRNKRIEICPDTSTDPRYRKVAGHPPTYPYRSIIAVPIHRGSKVVGCYTIDSRETERFQEDEDSLQEYKLYAKLFGQFMPIEESAIPNGKAIVDSSSQTTERT
jgi:GAF domain-containing protein